MEFVTLTPSSLSAEQNSATYSCTLVNTWSGATHPILYDTIEPTAHWSSPVLVTHTTSYPLWQDGGLASPGVERLAELGATDRLRNEISDAQQSGLVGNWCIGMDQFNYLDRPQTFDNILLTPEFPVLSSITMMAPSPDWFTGIPGFSPIVDGVWYNFFEILTYPWDAGTETGDAYSINNIAEDPQKPIQQLTVDTIPENGILLDPSGETVLPVALWSCLLQETETNNNDDHQNDSNYSDDCRNYLGMCSESSDCCSNNCIRGRCRGRERTRGRGRESQRLSNRGRDAIGGAAGRAPRFGSSPPAMVADAKTLMDELRLAWLDNSGEMDS